MRTIEIDLRELDSDGEMGAPKRLEIGTNDRDGGLFVRQRDGSWAQFAGNSQTPRFRTSRQLVAYLRRHHYTPPTAVFRVVRGSASW